MEEEGEFTVNIDRFKYFRIEEKLIIQIALKKLLIDNNRNNKDYFKMNRINKGIINLVQESSNIILKECEIEEERNEK